MLRSKFWVIGPISLVLVFVVAVRPEAGTRDLEMVRAQMPLAPFLPVEIGGCTTVESREGYERSDCLQAARHDLLEGAIDLQQALERLETCTWERQDLAELGTRAAEMRADVYRARLAFGEELTREEESAYRSLLEELGRRPAEPSPDAVERLRNAGITPAGLAPRREQAVLARLKGEAQLRRDFRVVFGERRAADLEALLTGGPEAKVAVVIGSTAVLPNSPPVRPTADGDLIEGPAASGSPAVVNAEVYAARIAAELRALEAARQRFLSSAARQNQRTGSIRTFFSSLRSLGREDLEGEALRRRIAQDRAALSARVVNLEGVLGADPLIVRTAGESVGLVTEINRTCEAVALNRRRWIRTGAGVVTGLVGAAGFVVVSGATGTMLGGLTIAAALEASVGAYLVARSERIGATIVSSARSITRVPEDLERRRFRRPDGEVELEDGNDGRGGGESEIWFDDLGEAHELAFLDGDGIDEEGDDFTESGPRENTIPPILPIDIPEDLRELPPILETATLRELRELSLPEIQERLDEFLAGSDPAAWVRLAQEEEVEVWSAEAMIEEARSALRLWERQRELSERFGAFFIQAELERLPVNRRGDVLLRAMGRYLHDREHYSESDDLSDLRERVAARLVSHCRAGASPGDLALSACTDETALSILLVAALRDAGVAVPIGSVLGVQIIGKRFEAVLYSRGLNQVYSLTRGAPMEGVVAPIYHPATFYYSYLLGHGVTPEIDVDRHLLIALPDRPMPPGYDEEECSAEEQRGFVSRAVDWLGSMVGVRRVSREDPCAGSSQPTQTASRGGDRSVGVTLPTPRNPLQQGGGQGGGGQGGGGGGGGDPLAANSPGDRLASGASAPSGDAGASGGRGRSENGANGGDGQAAAGGDQGDAASGAESGDQAENGAGRGGGGGAQTSAAGPDGSGTGEEGTATAGSGGDGGYGVQNVMLPSGPNLTGVGRETVRLAQRYDRASSLRITPWRLRDDEGMMTGSVTSVLYADNPRALERFDADDLFITLAPAEVEAQRRMQEADAFPIFQAETDCDSPNLPPRKVFRRVASGDPGFRYVYCDQNESMVIFRDRKNAESYASLKAPDRPLFLARLASERLARFERSDEIRRLEAFLADPNVLSGYSKDQISEMVKAAADLTVFQDALESALVQSMNELGPSGVRTHYYEMHRQVLQAPFFLRTMESVYRLNQRLASDPLQSLAWANAQSKLARQGFFDLYFNVGRMMEWPERWATLERRYGNPDAPLPVSAPSRASLDFLQILSDPTRVRIDWAAEKTGNPSIRDRQVMDGAERTPEEKSDPTLAENVERQDEVEHQRGGTGGLGKAGEGESIGPERGRRPLQMIYIRVQPEAGDPDRQRLPDDNQVRPGGTEGRRRQQTEESASRQEPILWVSPQTFVEAVLSTWDWRDLRPETAARIPPILRFNERLRELFLKEFRSVTGVYDNRLRASMEAFTRHGWLNFAEVRDAMGGPLVAVKAHDTGRFSGAYSGNAPINDQDQIRIPNFFNGAGVTVPADLFPPVREHFSRAVLGSFDLSAEAAVPNPVHLRNLTVPPGESADQARQNLLRTLELIRQQATEAN